MTAVIFIYIALTGLALGSFVNALVWRLHKQSVASKKNQSRKDLSIVNGRSMCTHCKHVLAPKDLIPVVSWLLLRGKCRYCGKRIEDTPLAELLTPTLCVVSYMFWPYEFTWTGWALFAVWVLIITCFVALALYDARWFILPDRIVAVALVLAVLFFALRVHSSNEPVVLFVGLLGAAALLPGFFALVYGLSKGTWIGFGDVKLAVVLALLSPSLFGAVVVLFAASCSGIIVSLQPLLSKDMTLSSKIPFGPFLLLGSYVAVLWADRMYALFLGV